MTPSRTAASPGDMGEREVGILGGEEMILLERTHARMRAMTNEIGYSCPVTAAVCKFQTAVGPKEGIDF